jgi:hypothetical protein
MGAVVLITLGVLFLLDSYHVMRFDQGLPVLFLVIGGVLLIARTGSTEGHVQPGWIAGSIAPPAQQPWTSSAVPPPPQPEQWTSGADNPPSSGQNVSSDQNDSQVKP